MTDPAQYDLSRVHLIGIGGSGMSGLARILAARGAVVTGSDVKDSTPVEVLRSMGAKVAIGHAADNLKLSGELPTTVVTSFAAIPQDNPELVAARENNIPLIRRSDLLAALMEGHTQVLLAVRLLAVPFRLLPLALQARKVLCSAPRLSTRTRPVRTTLLRFRSPRAMFSRLSTALASGGKLSALMVSSVLCQATTSV